MRILLAVLATVLAFACYEGGVYLWGIHHYRSAESALAARDLQAATSHVEKALVVWPKEPALHLLAARAARRRHQYDRAAAHLEQFTKNDGPRAALHLEQQLLRVQEGDLDDLNILLAYAADFPDAADTPVILEACLEGGLKGLAPAYAEGMTFAGGAAEPYVARLHQAVDQWLTSRPGVADQAQGLVWRGGIHGLENDRPQALADTRRALELDPDHFGARLQLAIFFANGDPAEALPHFMELHRRDRSNNQIRAWLAATHRNLGHLSEARVVLDELLAAEPFNVGALHERGKLAIDLGQPVEAEGWLRRALLAAPDDPGIHFTLSTCLQAAGRSVEAKQSRDRFLELQAERKRARKAKVPDQK